MLEESNALKGMFSTITKLPDIRLVDKSLQIFKAGCMPLYESTISAIVSLNPLKLMSSSFLVHELSTS